VHLGLDHYLAANAGRNRLGFLRGGRYVTVRHGDAGGAKQGSALVLMEIHGFLELRVCWSRPRHWLAGAFAGRKVASGLKRGKR
jgi:hypothetical protein